LSPEPGNTGPTATITNPTNNDLLNSLTSIDGTASDDTSPLKTVQVSIGRFDGTKYWNGSIWISTTTAQWVDATDTDPWYYDTLPDWNSEGPKYKLRARAIDDIDNVGDPSSEVVFTFDDTPPDSVINLPVDGNTYRILGTISGTASDAGSGVEFVKIRIYDTIDLDYYQGGGVWDSTDTYIVASGSTSWDYVAPTWESGHTYRINSRGIDFVPNPEVSIATATFTFDNTPPVSVITKPANNDNLSSLDKIEGTASDVTSSVSKVEILIKNITDTTYWDGVSTWISTATWFTVEGQESWYYDISDWTPDKQYQIQSRATDDVQTGNEESPGSGNFFKFDTGSPSSSISSPQHDEVFKSFSTISGAATDPGSEPSQIKKVVVTIQDPDDKYWKQGAVWDVDFTSHAAQGTSSWTLDISTEALTDQTTYLIKTKAIDKAGNEEAWGTPGDSNAHNFAYDLTDPQSVITVPTHLDHLSELPTISGTASDAFGLSEVRLSILKTLGTKYWHGSGWDDGEVWNLVYSTTNYTTWTSTGVDWDDNCDYVIKSKAWDNAQPGGNEESSGGEGSANVHRFTFDDTSRCQKRCGNG